MTKERQRQLDVSAILMVTLVSKLRNQDFPKFIGGKKVTVKYSSIKQHN